MGLPSMLVDLRTDAVVPNVQVLVTGSLYLVGDVLKHLKKSL